MSNDILPIASYRERIVATIRENPVTIITAETGAGKSTQVPQYLLAEDYDLVVTQPRRLAARTVSARVAEEYGTPHGDIVGFRTAYDEPVCSEATRCLFVTDGLALVRELMGKGSQVLVIDEVHEWNLNIEVLVAWAKRQIKQGVDFKVVLMSATLEADRLSAYFGDAPVISVPGRTFLVEEEKPTSLKLEHDVAKLLQQGRNVLVFQPGKREIGETVDLLKRWPDLNAEILPLHGELTPDEQARCFRSFGRPKCVVSTNVAQTSVTIPDIDAVVDSGMERRVELVDGVEGLYLRPISLADRDQRKGRAGRTKPGIYIDWCPTTERPTFPVAEILRVRLDQAVLRLAEAGIDMEGLEFFHQPDRGEIHEAKRALVALGCMDASGNVTKTGRRVAALPVSVKYGRMIVEAEKLSVVDDIVTVAAIMEQGGITARICPTHKRSGYPHCNCWQRLANGEVSSDVIAQLRAYQACDDMTREEMREAGIFVKAYFQAKDKRKRIARELKGKVREFQSSGCREDILKAVCAGMVDHLYQYVAGQYKNGNDYRSLSRDSVVSGGSSWNKVHRTPWLVAQPWDLEVKTRRGSRVLPLLTMASKVELDWIIKVAPQLVEVKRGVNPRYDFGLAEVVSTTETLFNGQVIESEEILDPTHAAASQLRRDGRNLEQWQSWADKPHIALPDPADDSTEIPPIATCTYGVDIETHEPLVAFGVVVPYGYRYKSTDPWFKVTWTRDEAEARQLHEATVSHLPSLRAEAKAAAERVRRAAELQAIKELAEPLRQRIRETYVAHVSALPNELRHDLFRLSSWPYDPDPASMRQWMTEAEALIAKVDATMPELAAQKAAAEEKRMALIAKVEALQAQAGSLLDKHRDRLSDDLDAELVDVENYRFVHASPEELQDWIARTEQKIEKAKALTRAAQHSGVSDDALAMLKGHFGSR